MPTSPCTNTKHNEYSCLIKWGVSGKKFKLEKWCEGCINHYSETYIVKEYLATNEREKQKKNNNTNTKNNESKPRRGRRKKNE